MSDRANCTVDFQPIGRRVEARPGATLLQAAQEGGIGLAAVCGGAGTCGRCLVQVMSGALSPVTDDERRRISDGFLAEGYRLACQAQVLSDCRVNVPPSSLTTTQRTQVEGRELDVPLDPVVRSYDVQLDPATREDLRSDATRLCQRLQAEGLGCLRVDLVAAQRLPGILRAHDWGVTAAVIRDQVVAVLPPHNPPLGIAVDLGTTKLAGYLVDLRTGITLAALGMMNPQIAYGEDVMARLTYVIQHEDGARQLQAVIVAGLDELAQALCEQAGQVPEDIVEAVIVGNTAMHHLLLGLPTEQLGAAPYVAALSEACDLMARDIGLSFAPDVYVHILPNIAGFVGADHVAMLLGSGIYAAEDVVLGLDIGTNTEVALKVGNRRPARLLTCSTASGPAFEGAHIAAGMRAAPGAVERVWIDGDRVSYQVIDDERAVGICGSGILDAVGQLRKIGLLGETGAMSLDHPRARQGERGPEFVLVPRAESGNEHDIVLTRGDVSEIQLAKGAMRAGAEVLMQEAGITVDDLDRIVIAGAFGSYIDVSNALRVGMFPSLPPERFEQVGNAAGVGARLALLSAELRARAQEIALQAEYVELTNDPRFTLEFTEAMMLP
jgi:uncharacterized 2Fe-2S/4Fe-4S cluster protein (DUF4445 family)